MESKTVSVIGALHKVGNSYSVRIPRHITNELHAKEGDMLALKIAKISLTFNDSIAEQFRAKARCIRALDHFSDDKVYILARLYYGEGVKLTQAIEQKKGKPGTARIMQVSTLEADALAQIKQVQQDYLAKIRREYGDKLLKEYLHFRKHIEPAMRQQHKQNTL
ncbi:MAG: AbrB/MazE/SpoVT family DNA-binding domain-containing protein [archaeon]